MINNIPFGITCFAKPDMALQKNCIQWFDDWLNRYFLRRFCKGMSGFAKLLGPRGKSWNVALLVGALHLSQPLLTTKALQSLSTSHAHNAPELSITDFGKSGVIFLSAAEVLGSARELIHRQQ